MIDNIIDHLAEGYGIRIELMRGSLNKIVPLYDKDILGIDGFGIVIDKRNMFSGIPDVVAIPWDNISKVDFIIK